MLVDNLIYKELFYLGYKGRENTYTYWIKNKDKVLTSIMKENPKFLENPMHLDAFEAKVRWKSPIGLLFLYEISRRINLMAHEKLDFQTMSIEYGKETLTLADFNRLYPLSSDEYSNGRFDIRGVSLIRLNMNGLALSDLDMRYSTLCNIDMSTCTFENCCMNRASLIRSMVDDTHFSSSCILYEVDFSDTYLGCQFDAKIVQPKISHLKTRDLKRIIAGFNLRWRAFTEIADDSFSSMCDDEKLNDYIEKMRLRVSKAYDIRKGPLLRRIVESIWTTI